MIVTEAFGGEISAAAAFSDEITDLSNFGDCTFSTYAIDADVQKLFAWAIESDGGLAAN